MKLKYILILLIIILTLTVLFLYFYPKINKPKEKKQPCQTAENCKCDNYSCDCDYYDEKQGYYVKIECPTNNVY